jgi:hypothetical protein
MQISTHTFLLVFLISDVSVNDFRREGLIRFIKVQIFIFGHYAPLLHPVVHHFDAIICRVKYSH